MWIKARAGKLCSESALQKLQNCQVPISPLVTAPNLATSHRFSVGHACIVHSPPSSVPFMIGIVTFDV